MIPQPPAPGNPPAPDDGAHARLAARIAAVQAVQDAQSLPRPTDGVVCVPIRVPTIRQCIEEREYGAERRALEYARNPPPDTRKGGA